jgi:hypothetical protein
MGCSTSNENQYILFDNRTKLCSNILRLCLTIENFVYFMQQNTGKYEDTLRLMIAADPQNLLTTGFFAILISQIDSKCYINPNLITEIKQYIEFLPSEDCNIQTTLTQLSNCNEELWIQRDKLQDSLHQEYIQRK